MKTEKLSHTRKDTLCVSFFYAVSKNETGMDKLRKGEDVINWAEQSI